MSTTTPPIWAPPTMPSQPPVPPTPRPGRWARLPRWAQITTGVVVAAVLVGIGASTTSTRTVTRIDTAKVDRAESALSVSQSTANSLQQRVNAQQGVIAELQAGASAVKAGQAQLDQQQTKLAQDQQAVAAQKAQLDQRQSAADATAFSDGLYQVGKDIQAGRYHSDGATTVSGNCYWAKLRSSDTSGSIIANNNSTGPQTVTIDSPYFTTDGCGKWTKVG